MHGIRTQGIYTTAAGVGLPDFILLYQHWLPRVSDVTKLQSELHARVLYQNLL